MVSMCGEHSRWCCQLTRIDSVQCFRPSLCSLRTPSKRMLKPRECRSAQMSFSSLAVDAVAFLVSCCFVQRLFHHLQRLVQFLRTVWDEFKSLAQLCDHSVLPDHSFLYVVQLSFIVCLLCFFLVIRLSIFSFKQVKVVRTNAVNSSSIGTLSIFVGIALVTDRALPRFCLPCPDMVANVCHVTV